MKSHVTVREVSALLCRAVNGVSLSTGHCRVSLAGPCVHACRSQLLSFPLIVSDVVALGRESSVAYVARLASASVFATRAEMAGVALTLIIVAAAWLLTIAVLVALLMRDAHAERPLQGWQLQVRKRGCVPVQCLSAGQCSRLCVLQRCVRRHLPVNSDPNAACGTDDSRSAAAVADGASGARLYSVRASAGVR